MDIPLVTSVTSDFAVHDLAADAAELLAGVFMPAGGRVLIDVQSAISIMGMSRGALFLYVGQPDVPGARLYDTGGQGLPGVAVHSVASINGESAWAGASNRRVVVDVDPTKPVTWQILVAIIGGSATVDVAPGPQRIAITPDGTRAFVTSPRSGAVTPVTLGRPGYSFRQDLAPMDVAGDPVAVAPAGSPLHVSVDNAHAVVSTADDVVLLSTATGGVVRRVPLPGGAPLGSAITPDGRYALVGMGAGGMARVELATGDVAVAPGSGAGPGDAVAVLPSGDAAFVAHTASGTVTRVNTADLGVEAVVDVGDGPTCVRAAPDGQVWVLCAGAAASRLRRIDPSTNAVVDDFALPYPDPLDFAIIPVAGQTSDVVRTAWVVYEGSRYSQFNIGGAFAGQVHSIHAGVLDGNGGATGVAVNDYGEIWVVQSGLDRVWRWPGGRVHCRPGLFFGEYCDVHAFS